MIDPNKAIDSVFSLRPLIQQDLKRDVKIIYREINTWLRRQLVGNLGHAPKDCHYKKKNLREIKGNKHPQIAWSTGGNEPRPYHCTGRANSTLTATLVPQMFLYSYRNFTKINSGRKEGTKVMLDSLDKKQKEQNRASLKRIIDTTIFCGENEIPLRGHWATGGRKPFRKGGQFSSVARVQIKLTVGKCTRKTLLIRSSATLDFTGYFATSRDRALYQYRDYTTRNAELKSVI
ncbi:hypothetical protein J6590_009507 [Homalodisca vitripennis]|nr:hypothetical protein J6590_009507 [Homalodisca vitripennis]